MDKKEKYYNFIVDDMVKNTEIDYEREIIKFPFLPYSWKFSSLIFPLSLFQNSFSDIYKHSVSKYGIREGEVKMIWDNYRKRIEPLIEK